MVGKNLMRLNMVDITNVDHRHAKVYLKTLIIKI